MPSQTNRLGTRRNYFNARGWTILLPWLPTCNASCASLIEHGYALTPQGRVVVYSLQHAQAVFLNLYTPCTMDAPSAIAPTFTFPVASTASGAAGPTTRSTPAGAAPSVTPLTGAQSVSTVRPLTSEERYHLVISPE
eukprot:6195884-Pleurochrysis_carterae.AAC.1